VLFSSAREDPHSIIVKGQHAVGSSGKCGVKRESIVLDQKAEGSWFMPIVELASLFSKVLSNFCRNLAIGHLVICFNTDDASTKSFIRETLFRDRPLPHPDQRAGWILRREDARSPHHSKR